MRVLHCIATLAGGGAERQLSYLAPALRALGVDVHVAFQSGGPNLARLERAGIALHHLGAPGHAGPLQLLTLLATARRIDPQLIQTWLPRMDILGSLAARHVGVPYILSERTSASAYGRGWRQYLRRRLGGAAAAVVANSEGGRAYWLGSPHPARVTVIPNGVPVADIRAATPATGGLAEASLSGPAILAVGRYCAAKNFLALVDAVELVLARMPDATAILVGDGPLRDALRERAAASPCHDRIRVGGFSDEVWALLGQASVLVAPSRFEGSPNVVLEAMAAACPLVVSDIPAHREILDASSAVFVDPARTDHMAAALLGVLRQPAEARARAQRASARVAGLTVEAAAARYRDLYADILARGDRATPQS